MHRSCRLCNARCCRYFCFQIDNPCTYEEFDQVRWYLVHAGISVHIDRDGDWWILIENRCRLLDETPKGPRCVAYEDRPLICRRFSPKTCDFTRGPYEYEHQFETADQLDAYARDVLGPQEFDAARRKMRGRRMDAGTRGRGDAGKGARDEVRGTRGRRPRGRGRERTRG